MIRVFLGCLYLIAFPTLSMTVASATIAIIIDDVGNSHTDKDVLDLPQEVTIAVLPHTPYGKQIAQKAATENREIMLHMPMEALSGNRLGKGGLESYMTHEHMRHQIENNIADMPYAVGVNNHMGSKLTQMREPMVALMESLKRHNLYFVDSRTTKFTVAEEVANDFGVTNWRRHVFLDARQSEEFVRKQLQYLLKRADKYGYAIAIGHPYPETMNVLREELPKLGNHYQIKRVSNLPKTTASNQLAYNHEE